MKQPDIKYGEVKEFDIGGGQIEKLRKYEIGLEIIPAIENRKEYHIYDGVVTKERINCPDADGIYLLVENFEHAKRQLYMYSIERVAEIRHKTTLDTMITDLPCAAKELPERLQCLLDTDAPIVRMR